MDDKQTTHEAATHDDEAATHDDDEAATTAHDVGANTNSQLHVNAHDKLLHVEQNDLGKFQLTEANLLLDYDTAVGQVLDPQVFFFELMYK